MKNKALVVILVASLLTNFYFLFGKRIPVVERGGRSFSKRVVRVIDGDTFDTEDGLRVRLAGVDAPEYPDGWPWP